MTIAATYALPLFLPVLPWSVIIKLMSYVEEKVGVDDNRQIIGSFLRYLEGDEKAFETFWALAVPQVRRYIGSRFNLQYGNAWCEDVVQEGMWKVHQARHGFVLKNMEGLEHPGDGALMSWVLQICRNYALDQLRRAGAEKRALAKVAESDVDSWISSDHHKEEEEKMEKILEMVEALPLGQREVVEMHSLQGLSMSEIASNKGMLEGAVRTRASRAYAALREMFSGEQVR